MPVRTALVLTMLGVVVLAGAILGFIEVASIERNVIREAQTRVDHDLRVVRGHSRVWAESEPGHWAKFSLELPGSAVPNDGQGV
jgi:hypothetical protein